MIMINYNSIIRLIYTSDQVHWPISQSGPSQPSRHWHTKLPRVFWQEAPFLQRNMGHSLTSSLQVGPVHPGGQRQINEPSVLIQVPLFIHGFNRHSFTSVWEYKTISIHSITRIPILTLPLELHKHTPIFHYKVQVHKCTWLSLLLIVPYTVYPIPVQTYTTAMAGPSRWTITGEVSGQINTLTPVLTDAVCQGTLVHIYNRE